MKPKPSKHALEMLKLFQTSVSKEVEGHLSAGRKVYGMRDGKMISLQRIDGKTIVVETKLEELKQREKELLKQREPIDRELQKVWFDIEEYKHK